MNPKTRSRNWSVTVFSNKNHEEWDTACKMLINEDNLRYYCFQEEIAPSTGTRHFQCFFAYKEAISFSSMRRKLFVLSGEETQPHIEKAKGSAKQNRDYCSKTDTGVPGTFHEGGDMPQQGIRSDLDRIGELLKEGTSLETIADEMPSQMIRYGRGIQALQQLVRCSPRTPETVPCVYWWFGPTGTGKSRRAFEEHKDAYVKMGGKWWDNYQGERTVIMDDFRPSFVPGFNYLLQLLDRYPMRVEGKGTSMNLSATTWIITCPSRPEVLWNGHTDEDIQQLLRRISMIEEFHPDGSKTILKSTEIPYTPLSKEERGTPAWMTAMTFKPC